MRAVDVAQRILRIWEHGADRAPAERAGLALELLAPSDAASPALHADDAASVRLLISLFGPRLDVVVCCPQCENDFDLTLDLTEFAAPVRDVGSVAVEWNGFAAVVRPPCRGDLVEIGIVSTPAAFASTLFVRCVEEATCSGRPIDPHTLPPQVRSAAATALSEQGGEGPAVDLQCGACGHEWLAPLHAAGALLRKIDDRALRLLDDVHRIASAYHWSESDILGLSPSRRRFYLEALR